MVEILGSSSSSSGQADKEMQENVPTLTETVKLSAGKLGAADGDVEESTFLVLTAFFCHQ